MSSHLHTFISKTVSRARSAQHTFLHRNPSPRPRPRRAPTEAQLRPPPRGPPAKPGRRRPRSGGCFPPAALPGPRGAASRMLAAGLDMAAPSAALRQRRAAAAGGSGAPETPGRAEGPESAGGGVGPLLSPGTFWLTRIVLLRAVALLYRECPGAAAAPRSLSRERVGDGPALRAARLAASRAAGIPEGLGLLVVLRAAAGQVGRVGGRCEGLSTHQCLLGQCGTGPCGAELTPSPGAALGGQRAQPHRSAGCA